MKNLFNKIFNKEPQFDYVIAEYLPITVKSKKNPANVANYNIESPESRDEMAIDNIYQSQ